MPIAYNNREDQQGEGWRKQNSLYAWQMPKYHLSTDMISGVGLLSSGGHQQVNGHDHTTRTDLNLSFTALSPHVRCTVSSPI